MLAHDPAFDAAAFERRLAQGGLPFTEEDFQGLAAIMQAETGVVLDEGKKVLVYSRLAKRLRSLGLKSFKSYCTHISTPAGLAERRMMIEALTTNVTGFFREAHHFDHLVAETLPPLIEMAQRGGRVRLWSAGCSSGEEPYSIALSLLSLLPDAYRYDIKILATDIDSQILAQARDGRYSDTAVAKIDPALRARWFERSRPDDQDLGWRAGEEMRSLVSFRLANLVGEWPMSGPFQVIFCRNVVIYFDEISRDQVLTKLAALLSPGGLLYVGHSERLKPEETGLNFVGASSYQRPVGSRS